MDFALVTGAAGGIGQAVCLALAAKGFNIIAHYFSAETAVQELCEKIRQSFGVCAVPLKADFRDEQQVRQFAGQCLEKGEISVIVNNAGISEVNLFQDVLPQKARDVLAVNISSPMALTQEILPSMIRRKSGRIINISSIWGVTGGSCEVHYSASKAAIIGFTKALSKEVGPSNITVNCIAPGLIDTKMNACFSKEELQAVTDEIPLCRIGTPQDVAAAVAFFAQEEAGFITGQVLGVDGGF